MNANDIETTLRARAAFNDSIEHLDGDTRGRLRGLRLQALTNGKRRRARARWAWSVASVLAVLAVVMLLPRTPPAAAPAATAVVAQPAATVAIVHQAQTTTTSEIVASDPIEAVDPDMLSDLDFYGWLAEQQNTDASGG